jgi:tetratricopeptide (TPR) repeat protein
MPLSDFNKLTQETFEHLHAGRARVALKLAKELMEKRPESAEAAICFAWASLDTGDAVSAKEYTDLSEQLEGDPIITRMYRGYMQMRLSSFEGAVYDFNMTEGIQKNLLAWTYLNKAKSLASMNDYSKAVNFYNLAIIIDNNSNPEWKTLKKYFNSLEKMNGNLSERNSGELEKLFELAKEASSSKEYWYALLVVKQLNSECESYKINTASLLLELDMMLKMNQFSALEEKLEQLKEQLNNEERFIEIQEQVNKYKDQQKQEKKKYVVDFTEKSSEDIALYDSEDVKVKSLKLYDAVIDKDSPNKNNLVRVNLSESSALGCEIVLENFYFNKEDKKHSCFAAWYLEEDFFIRDRLNWMFQKTGMQWC